MCQLPNEPNRSLGHWFIGKLVHWQIGSLMTKPLESIRVLDLSRLLPGPYCTMLLADLRAEVIKIETPQLGDYMRLIPPFIENPTSGEMISAAYLMVNRNKKSVALNFRNGRGRDVFMR